MELLSNLSLGLATAIQPLNLIYCFIGVLLGTLIGVLPGIGPTATVAILLPITVTLPPTSALIMLAGIYYGAQYGGSTTAILINVPGESSSAVTAIDGYQMRRKGKAGTALAVAAVSSFFAGTVATFVVALAAPVLTEIALDFGPPEYFALIVLGLIASVVLAHGSIVKALAMIVVGLLLGLIGTDVNTAAPRFTLGLLQLSDGLSFVAVAIGIFGLGEILKNLEEEHDRPSVIDRVANLFPSKDEIRQCVAPVLRGTFLGCALGILPGGGALLASFAAYSIEKKLSRSPWRFGKGAIEGVAAPEGANNAAAQTSFIPMLTLGIPANPVMALMIGGLIVQGISPGPQVATAKPDLFWGVIASMWIGNVMLVVLNLPLIGIWVKLLRIPYYILFPSIVAFSIIGVYSIGTNAFDLYTLSTFAFIGYVLVKMGGEPAPLLLGFILGPMVEEHFRRSLIISQGDPTIFLQRPISGALLALALFVLVLVSLPSITRTREQAFIEE